jgi:hypothetical protein
MKTLLLCSLLLTVSTLFAQIPQQPGFPCPIEIKSNQGGGNCTECVSSTPGQQPNGPGDFTQGTGVVTLNFGPNAQLNCIPRLLRVIDKEGFVREVLCGLGKRKETGNEDVIVEYCLFGDNDFNFFNQPDVTAVLSYECGVNAAVIIACNNEGEQIPLPVHFSSFTATRSNSSAVSITWTTAMEQSNKGFNIQKNVNGEWRNIAFVASQAQDGTSSSALSYSYTDLNTEKGITQYRIQQVDLNGKFAYTDIRAIRGDGNISKIVIYPNPSADGKVNVVFEDNTAIRDVFVNDMQGKVVRSFKGISNNILVIEKLTTGFYTIKVTNRTTNASSVQKVVIK